MEVIALVGQSGTGKSHRALMVANEYQADAIIDDGILIRDGKIVAGKSAKHEKSKIMAVRRAIFVLPGHAEEVGEALREDMPNRILIPAPPHHRNLRQHGREDRQKAWASAHQPHCSH